MLDANTLNKFIGKANHAHQQFCIWISANNEFAKYQDQWNQIDNPDKLFALEEFTRDKGCKYKNFWDVVIASLQHSWILSTARLFDPAYHPGDKKRKNPRLSMEYILELLEDDPLAQSIQDKLKKYQPTIKSLKELRDNFIAHNDVNFIPTKIEAGVGGLFDELDRIITDLKREKPHLRDCNSLNLKYTEKLSQYGVDEIFEALVRS